NLESIARLDLARRELGHLDERRGDGPLASRQKYVQRRTETRRRPRRTVDPADQAGHPKETTEHVRHATHETPSIEEGPSPRDFPAIKRGTAEARAAAAPDRLEPC